MARSGRLEKPFGFDYSAFSGAFQASKYANLADEIRHSARRRKATNLRNSSWVSICPKSKNIIFNINRKNKLKDCVPAFKLHNY